IDLLAVRAVAQRVIGAQVDAGTRATGGRTARYGIAAGDLVFELRGEVGDVEVVAVHAVPVQRDFAIDAGFRRQVGVAGKRRGTLAAEPGDAVVKIGGLRCLVAGADAALHGPGLGQVVDAIQT